jgi:hypothetical protein
MIGRILLACAMVLGLGHISTVAQSGMGKLAASQERAQDKAHDWARDYTVLTIYGNAWGAATDPIFDRAIARAIADCNAMSGTDIGCGAFFISVQAGWSLGVICGRKNIVVSDKDLSEAERVASRRELDLRTHYVPDMPPCVRVVTIDPNGRFVTR